MEVAPEGSAGHTYTQFTQRYHQATNTVSTLSFLCPPLMPVWSVAQIGGVCRVQGMRVVCSLLLGQKRVVATDAANPHSAQHRTYAEAHASTHSVQCHTSSVGLLVDEHWDAPACSGCGGSACSDLLVLLL